jgi:hypothetical protein
MAVRDNIIQLAAARPPAREISPPEPVSFVGWLDPSSLRAVNDDRPDLYAQLTSLPARPVVTWPARLLVWAVMLAVSAYCAEIWATGGAL